MRKSTVSTTHWVRPTEYLYLLSKSYVFKGITIDSCLEGGGISDCEIN